MTTRGFLLMLLPACVSATADPTAHFVNKNGNDANDGLSRETALRSIGRGVAALQPGDTLTIGPGEYREHVESAFTGAPGKRTLIRAEIPGTVWLRGDEPGGEFQAAPGSGPIWEADVTGPIEAVNELDTFTIYTRRPTRPALDFYSESWYHDKAAGKLYIRTSDSRAPERHRITLVRKAGFGLSLDAGGKPICDVTIDGLVFSGFNSLDRQPWKPGYFTKWGLYIYRARNCVVRNCTALLNGGGLALGGAQDSIIEDCRAYGNYAHESPGGGIVIFGPAKDCVIRRSVAHDSQRAGIRFYAGDLENCRIEDCTAWNNAYSAFWLKGLHQGDQSRYTRCVTPGTMQSTFLTTRSCVAGSFHSYNKERNGGYNLSLGGLDQDRVFADPARLDFRPQAGAPFLGQAPDGGDQGLPFDGTVFYLKSDGDDGAAGNSVAAAWRTLAHAADRLQPGHTLYILPGTYPGGTTIRLRGSAGAPVMLRARTGEPVVFRGGSHGLVLTDSAHVILEGLNWVDAEQAGLKPVNASDITVKHCGFAGTTGIFATQCANLYLAHNALNTPASLHADEVRTLRLEGNYLAGTVALDRTSRETLYSDYNGWGNDACVRYAGTRYALAAWQQTAGTDLHSSRCTVTFVAPGRGAFQIADSASLAGRGPRGMPIGPFRLCRLARPSRILKGELLSVTDTSANLEWHCGRNDDRLTLEWGPDPDCANRVELAGDSALKNISLTDLRPGSACHYRVAAVAQPVYVLSQNPAAGPGPDADATPRTERLQTAAAAPAADRYHVAPGGDDANTGLSRDSAWRTVAHAAARVHAGDTVLIHEGTYVEQIIVRTTGTAQSPIVFRNAPGEKVVFSGEDFLPTIWSLTRKTHVTLDGFHFIHPAQAPMRGVVEVRNCGEIVLQRCVYDGRCRGNSPSLIASSRTQGVTLRHNVAISGFFGANISGCRRYTIENNVFYIPLVLALHVMGDRDATFIIRNNIFYDLIDPKLRNALFYFHEGDNTILDEYNCYYVRLPGDVRQIYSFGPAQEHRRYTLEAFCRATGQAVTSFFANPNAKVLSHLRTYASMDDYLGKKGVKGGNESGTDPETKAYLPFRRSDFIPANPACVKAGNGRPVGLDPDVFEAVNGVLQTDLD